MALPDRLDLALAAAGLISLLHNRMGLRLSEDPPPDMRKVAEDVGNWVVLACDYISTHLPRSLIIPVWGKGLEEPIVHDDSDDDKPEHEEFPDPPKPPEGHVTQRIPRL